MLVFRTLHSNGDIFPSSAAPLFSALCEAPQSPFYTWQCVYVNPNLPVHPHPPRPPTVHRRELSSVLCDDLQGWDGEGGRGAQREGIYIYIYVCIYRASLVAQVVKNLPAT